MIVWIYILIALLITVFLHELAHTLVALACGVKVKAFVIGFGKPLISKKLWGINFGIAPIPLGGYCRLHGEKSKVKEGWLAQRYSKKIAIALAGVTVNLLIAFLCYWINFKSIKFGLHIDFLLLKSILTKDYESIFKLLTILTPNLFVLLLGMLNLFAAITNISPFPPLDGSFVWLFPLERIYKEKFPVFLEKITKIGFVVLIILQAVFLYWIWFI